MQAELHKVEARLWPVTRVETLVLAILLAPLASAQAAASGQVLATLNGADLRDADAVSHALALDTGRPAALPQLEGEGVAVLAGRIGG